jgi:hypothetical protein
MSNSRYSPINMRGTDAPLAQYVNDNSSLEHPRANRVFACGECDEAPVRYEPASGACWCPDCGASLDANNIIDRNKHENLRFLGPAGKALWYAPPDTPVDELSELEVEDR